MTHRAMANSGHLHFKTVSHRNCAFTDKINPAARILLRKSSSSHGNIDLFYTIKGPLRQRHLSTQIYAAIKKVSSKNVACSKTLVALPGKEGDIEALCQQVVTFSKQRMGDRSAGIIQFDCSKDADEETGTSLFHFWELYESNAALGRHNTTPEYESFMKKVQVLLDGPVGMVLYEMKDGKLGMASVQGGPRGEGGLDDATGASGAAGGASYKQTSGVVDLTKKEEEEEDRGLWGIKLKLPWMKKKGDK